MSISENTPDVLYTWTGPPGVKWIKEPPAGSVAVALFCIAGASVLVGFVLAAMLFDTSSGLRAPEELTAQEKSVYQLTQKLWPLQMRLRVISKSQFEHEEPFPTLAFSKPTIDPCEITIPDSWSITFNPSNPYPGGARWTDPGNGSILAHEILHCYRGHWHVETGN